MKVANSLNQVKVLSLVFGLKHGDLYFGKSTPPVVYNLSHYPSPLARLNARDEDTIRIRAQIKHRFRSAARGFAAFNERIVLQSPKNHLFTWSTQ